VGLKRTYEELKLVQFINDVSQICSLKRTYEELKQGRGALSRGEITPFKAYL